MIDYKTNKHALDIPWIESPFFYDLLENSSLTPEQKEQCAFYHENGYLIIDLDLDQSTIDSITTDMYKAIEDEKTKFHAEHFQYTETKRIFEYWKHSKPIAELTKHPVVLDTLSFLYNRKPFPSHDPAFIRQVLYESVLRHYVMADYCLL